MTTEILIITLVINQLNAQILFYNKFTICLYRPPLWSSGQSFWLQIHRSRVRSPALPDFLSSSGSGTGSLSLVRSIGELLE